MTADEREAVAAEWVRVGGLAVVVSVASASGREAARLAAHAGRIGADAVSTTAPFYFRPTTARDVVAFVADIAAAAPKLPFYYYDIPSVTGVNVSAAEVARRAVEVIPNFAGVKFSNPDLLTLQECVGSGLDVRFGIDECLLAAVALGVGGAVGSTYNYAAPVYRRMLDRWHAGDVAGARAEQTKAASMVRTLIDFGGLRAGKVAMKLLGVDCGPVRPPLRPTTADKERALFDRWKQLSGVFARPLHFVGE
jgi:N-acetylneuraminate lyase